jgi:hypothetical protein
MTFYRLLIAGGLGLYLAAGILGWEVEGGQRQQIPASVRQSPGGYRSFHFWHSGFHGGK